jgi:CRP/FNR family transcriptional regulator
MSEFKHIALFAQLDPVALKKLAAVASQMTCDDGQIVMLEGDTDAPVFFVRKGTVRAFRTNLEGREQTLIYLEPGAAFNMPAAFSDQRTAPASAVAVGEVRLLCIPPQDFRRVVSETPAIALIVLGDFSAKLYHLTDLTHNLGLRSVRARLARFVLEQAQMEHDSAVHWTQEQIAAQIGTVREVVSRTMRAFVKDGLIEMNRQRISVLDLDALEREAAS